MMMKNEKVLMKRKDFSEMRKDMDLNSSKEFQIENSNLIIDMFRWKPTSGVEFGESFSRFYIIDNEGDRKFGLCTLQELDYIEIDKKDKRVT